MWTNLFLGTILTEAITQIITKSEITKPIRSWFFDRRKTPLFGFIHELLDCGYCFSVWVGLFVALLLFYNEGWLVVFVFALVLHRLSNVCHMGIDRLWGNK